MRAKPLFVACSAFLVTTVGCGGGSSDHAPPPAASSPTRAAHAGRASLTHVLDRPDLGESDLAPGTIPAIDRAPDPAPKPLPKIRTQPHPAPAPSAAQ